MTELEAAVLAFQKRVGSLGGQARALALTKEQRQKIARKAAKARWRKPRKK